MLMRHKEHGWTNASDIEIEGLKKEGWLESSEEERQKIIASKNEGVIITAQAIAKGKPGRKPKNLTDGLGDEYSTNPD